jgi:hypothetical protein
LVAANGNGIVAHALTTDELMNALSEGSVTLSDVVIVNVPPTDGPAIVRQTA